MAAFRQVTSAVVHIPNENIDTDQIIPARFMKITDKQGLGVNLFYNWRYDDAGNLKPDFIINKPEAKGRQILLAGHNFACGSSREHAPWALLGGGFSVVISTLFADIFRNNSLKNGLLPVMLAKADYDNLVRHITANPAASITVDLESQTVTDTDGSQYPFEIDPFSRTCLLNGVDELGYILGHMDEIKAYENKNGKNHDRNL